MKRPGSFLNRTHLTIVLLALFLWCQSGKTQVYSFRHFGLDRNIFPSRIECISQASNGELLIGTLAGLVTYDGFEFRQIGEKEGLAENAVSAIGVTDGYVWVGHWAGSLTLLNLRDRSVNAINLQKELSFSSVRSLLPVSANSALLATADGHAHYYLNNGLERILLPLSGKDEKVVQLYQNAGRYYAITDRGIYRCIDSTRFTGWELEFAVEGKTITSVLQVEPDQWIIGTTAGVLIRNIRTNEVVDASLEKDAMQANVICIEQDMEEFVWIATAEQGVILYHPITREVKRVKRDNGLSYNQVRALFVDREGSAWVGTAAGLDQYLGRSFVLFDTRIGLPDNLVWDFLIADGSMLLATANGARVIHLDEKGVPLNGSYAVDIDGREPRRLFMDGIDHSIWIIDTEGGLWKGSSMDAKFHRLVHVDVPVRCIEEVNGVIWIGTDKGIFSLENEHLSEQYTAETGLGGNKVNGIYYSRVKNETWITILGGAATLYRDGRFRKYGVEQGLTSNVIQDAAFDRDGNVWFATYDEGVFYFQDTQFVNLSEKVELTSNTTFAIEINEQGSVWIGHSWGLDLYRIPFEDIAQYGSDQGFMGVEVNPGAMRSDEHGNLWMGTLMGLLKFTPANFRTNIVEPLSEVISATLGGQELYSDEQDFSLDFESNDLVVTFRGISLSNPSKNEYKYRLVGVHDDWRTKSSPLPIEYVSLPPGDFTFELIACNNSGKCNTPPLQLSFSIKPPFYRSWWFYTLVFLAVVLTIFLMDRYRVLSLLDEKNALEERLVHKEQLLIEVQQERDEQVAFRKYSEQVARYLNTSPDPKSIVLPQWMSHCIARQIRINAVSSDQFFEIKIGPYDAGGMIDVGVTGIMAGYIMTELKLNWLQAAITSPVREPIDCIHTLQAAMKKTFRQFEKHRALSWAIWIHNGESRLLHLNGLSIFLYGAGEIHEAKSSSAGPSGANQSDLVEISGNDAGFIASDGLFEQLNNDGTKNYTKARLQDKLRLLAGKSAAEICEAIEEDLVQWRGSMEQQEDITLICCSHGG